MKQIKRVLLAVSAVLVLIVACMGMSACSGSASATGSYRYDHITIQSDQYGPVVLLSGAQVLTLYDDGTYMLSNNSSGWTGTSAGNLQHGGFTYSRSMNNSVYAFGAFTEVSNDAELEELVITLDSVTRAISKAVGYGSDSVAQGDSASSADADAILALCGGLAGTTVTIDTSTGVLSELISLKG